MPTSEVLEVPGYEAVWRVDCAGAVAFVALHAVLRGHAFGGIRIADYATEQEALNDALALSRAMSRKVVLTGIEGGGGKSVLMAPGPDLDRSACVAALGEFIESLDGRYCCGPDLGFSAADDVALRSTTSHVAADGMSASTANSVLASMLAACPEPRRVAIAGLGAVGLPLAQLLRARGVEVLAADVRPVAGFELLDPQTIHRQECDVFAPCAAGAVLNETTIPELQCGVICGGANNPCASADDIERLHERGIVYVPDMVANCGAAIVGASATLGESQLIAERLAAVGPRMTEILLAAAERSSSPHHVAVELADARIEELRRPSVV
ncbi:MAG: leucine dehydrogenase [Pseudohongiellaceae bacterium]|jgi:leucine dehydrogenase